MSLLVAAYDLVLAESRKSHCVADVLITSLDSTMSRNSGFSPNPATLPFTFFDLASSMTVTWTLMTIVTDTVTLDSALPAQQRVLEPSKAQLSVQHAVKVSQTQLSG